MKMDLLEMPGSMSRIVRSRDSVRSPIVANKLNAMTLTGDTTD